LRKKILSIHWGFSIGGVAKYAVLIDGVSQIAPVDIHNLVLISRDRHVDEASLNELEHAKVVNRGPLIGLRWFRAINAEIDALKPDLILTHGFNGHFVALAASLAGRGRGLLKACSYHGIYYPPSVRRWLAGVLFNWFTEYYLKRQIVGAIVVADYCRRFLLSKGVAPGKIHVVHNGIPDIDPPKAESIALRKEWGVDDSSILIGAVSRLDPVKGIHILLEAFRAVADEHKHIRLVIIGTGVEEEKLKQKAETLGILSKVIFPGFRRDIAACMNAFDIFTLPSLFENHSIGILEAMRAGVAMVVTDVGGNTESVRNETEALVVPSGDSVRLAECLARLAGDPSLRSALGEAARKRYLEKFTVDKIVSLTSRWLCQWSGVEDGG